MRDPFGIRPLCLGRLPGGGWVVASEYVRTCQTVGARFEREVQPGEIVQIDAGGLTCWQTAASAPRRRSASSSTSTSPGPTARSAGGRNYLARQAMGRSLAREHPPTPTSSSACRTRPPRPRSAMPQQSGIPYSEGLVKNRYIGRTFIQPDQRLRAPAWRSSSTRCPKSWRASAWSSWTTASCAARPRRPSSSCCARPARREVHMRIHAPPMMPPLLPRRGHGPPR